MIQVNCPHCSTRLSLMENMVYDQVNCSACGKSFALKAETAKAEKQENEVKEAAESLKKEQEVESEKSKKASSKKKR